MPPHLINNGQVRPRRARGDGALPVRSRPPEDPLGRALAAEAQPEEPSATDHRGVAGRGGGALSADGRTDRRTRRCLPFYVVCLLQILPPKYQVVSLFTTYLQPPTVPTLVLT